MEKYLRAREYKTAPPGARRRHSVSFLTSLLVREPKTQWFISLSLSLYLSRSSVSVLGFLGFVGMAPRKRKTTEQEEKQLVAQDSGQRVTRSMARPAPSGSSAEPRPVAPARKKAKEAQKKKGRAKKEEVEPEEAEAVKEEEDNSGESKTEAEEENENKKKKGKEKVEAEAENKEEKGKEKVEAEAENKEEKGKAKVEDDGEGTEADDDESDKRTIVIEHCKQCKSFKVRADQVKNGLEKGVPGIKVLLNPDKPRKGCLEIREEGGETFLSLLDMKRPFSNMKALNMEEVISDIIEKIK